MTRTHLRLIADRDALDNAEAVRRAVEAAAPVRWSHGPPRRHPRGGWSVTFDLDRGAGLDDSWADALAAAGFRAGV